MSEMTAKVDRARIVVMVHAIKQFCFGFETMFKISSEVSPGSAAIAFYLNSLYQYIAAFFLLDKGSQSMGGMFYEQLTSMGLEHRLDSIRRVVDAPLGKTSFGEVVLKFRNKFITHGTFHSSDLDRLYNDVDMHVESEQHRFQDLLTELYLVTKQLAIDLCDDAGIPLNDVGISLIE